MFTVRKQGSSFKMILACQSYICQLEASCCEFFMKGVKAVFS